VNRIASWKVCVRLVQGILLCWSGLFWMVVVGITGGNCMQLGVGSIRCSWMVS
jgi:hypothetical protein